MNPNLLIRLETQLDALELFTGLSEEAFTQRPISDKWSAHENLAHIGQYHSVFLARLKRIATEDEPEFERFKADTDPDFLAWVNKEPGDVLFDLNKERGVLLDFLKEQEPLYFNRCGKHRLYGTLTVESWLELFLLHEAHHLFVAFGRARA